MQLGYVAVHARVCLCACVCPQVATCNVCEGSGQSFTPCEKCGGDGRIRETKRIALNVSVSLQQVSNCRHARELLHSADVHRSLLTAVLLDMQFRP